MTNFPPPFTPPDCDLRGMEWMPLYGDRLFASETWLMAGPEGRCAALALWWASWKQRPAGSLADQDRMLAQIAGYGMNVKAWQAVREEAMRGWIKCSDGRLYHPVVSEFAMEAWDRRKKERERKATYRAKYINGHGGGGEGQDADVPRDKTGTGRGTEPGQARGRDGPEDVPGTADRKRQDRTGQEKEKKERPLATLAPSAGAEAERNFEAFWQAFPRKVGRGAAVRAFAAACRKAPAAAIIAAVERAVWSPNPRFIPHPTTWLHDERWTDEVEHPDAALLRVMGLTRGPDCEMTAFHLR